MTARILRAAHDELGHNGSTRTYMLIYRLYYWKDLKTSVKKHIKQYMTCQKRNIQAVKYAQLHFSIPRLPMQFILINLVGPIDPSSNGYHYALIVICVLTGYTFCIPLKTKPTAFGGSMKILSDNGTEFKNQLIDDVAT